MKICIDLNEDQITILNKICLDNNYPKFIAGFLQKNLFSSLMPSVCDNSPTHVAYYNEVERIAKQIGLKQGEISQYLGLSQAAVNKAFKLRNDNSVIYRTMQQSGRPDNFLFDVYIKTLIDDPYSAIITTAYSGGVYDYLTSFLAHDFQKREACFSFIMLLAGFSKKHKPKKYEPELFFTAVKKLDKRLFLDFNILLVSDFTDIEGHETFCYRSAEKLYTALKEYYLSLEL